MFRSFHFPGRAARADSSIQQVVLEIDDFRGLRYRQVLDRIQKRPTDIRFRKNGQVARTWADQRYSVTLLFDDEDICLGVEEERIAAADAHF